MHLSWKPNFFCSRFILLIFWLIIRFPSNLFGVSLAPQAVNEQLQPKAQHPSIPLSLCLPLNKDSSFSGNRSLFLQITHQAPCCVCERERGNTQEIGHQSSKISQAGSERMKSVEEEDGQSGEWRREPVFFIRLLKLPLLVLPVVRLIRGKKMHHCRIRLYFYNKLN